MYQPKKKYSYGRILTLDNNIGLIKMNDNNKVFTFNIKDVFQNKLIKEGSKVKFLKSFKKNNNKIILKAIDINII